MALGAPHPVPRTVYIDACARAAIARIVPPTESRGPRQLDLFGHAAASAWAEALAPAFSAARRADLGPAPRKPAPPARPVDPILAALRDEPRISRLLGAVSPADDPDASAFVAIDRDSAVPTLKIYYRGVRIPADPVRRAFDDKTGRVITTDQHDGEREMDIHDLKAAASLALETLAASGLGARHTPAEVRRLKIKGFCGAVATLRLARDAPRAVSAAR